MMMWLLSWRAVSRMCRSRFLPLAACRRCLDTVVDGVANQMKEGFADLVDDGLVQFSLVPFELEIDLLAVLAGQVAHQTGKSLEDDLTGSMRAFMMDSRRSRALPIIWLARKRLRSCGPYGLLTRIPGPASAVVDNQFPKS